MLRFDLVVFDWDGTLMDSAAAIAAAIQAACLDLGFAVPDDERASHVIGLGLHDAIQHVLPGLAVSEYGRMIERYRHHYLSRDTELGLFAGTRELLADLRTRGHLLAVATGKSRAGLSRALEAAALESFFHATRCADETASKPAPDMLLALMAELQVAPARTLMIGDTTHDLQMAANAGVAAVAVHHGAHPLEQLAALEPLAVLPSTAALGRWLSVHA